MREHVLLFCLVGLVLIAAIMLLRRAVLLETPGAVQRCRGNKTAHAKVINLKIQSMGEVK
jgi:hypothetical protein